MPESTETPIVQFLMWVTERPRTYADVMTTWRSTCPRLSVWEDALLAGLVEIDRADETNASIIKLTPRGKSVLANAI